MEELPWFGESALEYGRQERLFKFATKCSSSPARLHATAWGEVVDI